MLVCSFWTKKTIVQEQLRENAETVYKGKQNYFPIQKILELDKEILVSTEIQKQNKLSTNSCAE